MDHSLVQQQGSTRVKDVRFQALDLSVQATERLREKALLVHMFKLIEKTGASLRMELLAI